MYMKTSERSSREGGSPAREGGSPAREGGSPAREGGSPAREGGSPAREGGSPAREGSTQTVVMERQDPSASKSVVIAPCEVAVTPPCQNQIMAQTGMSESDQFRKALFQGKLRKPLTNIDLLKRIDVIQHHIRWLPPVEPPSRQCPGIYLKGCIGQLRLQCPDVRETVVWVCHIDVPNGKPSSCGYRYYPRPREAYPTLDLSLKSNTTFQVCAFDGSEDAVRGCGGIEPLVALAGIDVSKALHRDSKSGGDDGVCMSLEFPLDTYRVVHSCFAKLNKNIDMKIQPARGIPDNVLNFFLYVVSVHICTCMHCCSRWHDLDLNCTCKTDINTKHPNTYGCADIQRKILFQLMWWKNDTPRCQRNTEQLCSPFKEMESCLA